MRPQRALVGLFTSFLLVAAAPSPASVQAEVGSDGSVVIQGVHYSDAVPLKAKLDELKRRHADIELHLKSDPDRPVRFEVVGKAILLLQKAGYTKIGFITAPRTR